MKRSAPLITLIGITLLLAACQEPLPTHAYEGTTTTAGVVQPLTLTYEQRGDQLTGEYQIRAAKGTFRGTLDGTTISAELSPSSVCIYTFDGAVAGTSLSGEFQPTDCIGGETGNWALERR